MKAILNPLWISRRPLNTLSHKVVVMLLALKAVEPKPAGARSSSWQLRLARSHTVARSSRDGAAGLCRAAVPGRAAGGAAARERGGGISRPTFRLENLQAKMQEKIDETHLRKMMEIHRRNTPKFKK